MCRDKEEYFRSDVLFFQSQKNEDKGLSFQWAKSSPTVMSYIYYLLEAVLGNIWLHLIKIER